MRRFEMVHRVTQKLPSISCKICLKNAWYEVSEVESALKTHCVLGISQTTGSVHPHKLIMTQTLSQTLRENGGTTYYH